MSVFTGSVHQTPGAFFQQNIRIRDTYNILKIQLSQQQLFISSQFRHFPDAELMILPALLRRWDFPDGIEKCIGCVNSTFF